ncbi:MAG: hypothetical protein BEU03_00305 [Marine Group III euryarchaeote CG-Epi6]|uniref:Uncharacterized protein n=1 Tax=Marine Group III euryarchaeote CG-Epi6 TaxID=1889000 RepID=A0A1J5SXE5_9ARCH|nr:MAG: hypothetical protein BEU03_00305 [Marine Group III euryarchaeote CG-Epi6]
MRKVLGIIIIIMMLPIAKSEIDDYTSHPGNIPNFHNFETPQLEPGENSFFSFEIQNRYVENITNVSINAEIYHRADIDESESLEKINSGKRPIIGENCWNYKENDENCSDSLSSDKAGFNIEMIAVNQTIQLKFDINTNDDTIEGTYFVRFSMNYQLNETDRTLQSRGFWDMEQWTNATTNLTDDYPGNINLDSLNVDGIIPDSSFGIKKPIPKWPLYILITLTVVFAGLSVIFYLEEEETYPELNKWLQKMRGKFNQFWLRFKY